MRPKEWQRGVTSKQANAKENQSVLIVKETPCGFVKWGEAHPHPGGPVLCSPQGQVPTGFPVGS